MINTLKTHIKNLRRMFEKMSNFMNPHPIGDLSDLTHEEIKKILTKDHNTHLLSNDFALNETKG